MKFEEISVYLVTSEVAELTHINQQDLFIRLVNSACFETVLSNSVTVYDNDEVVTDLDKLSYISC